MAETKPAESKPYTISMVIDLSGLLDVPQGQGPTFVFFAMAMQMMLAWGKQQGGGTLKEQKLLYRIRQRLDEAMKTNDTQVRLDEEEFQFLDKCRTEARMDMNANEALMRVNGLIEDAIERHNKT